MDADDNDDHDDGHRPADGATLVLLAVMAVGVMVADFLGRFAGHGRRQRGRLPAPGRKESCDKRKAGKWIAEPMRFLPNSFCDGMMSKFLNGGGL